MIISSLNQSPTSQQKPVNYPALYMSKIHGHVVMFIDNCTGMILRQGSYVNGVGVTIYEANGCNNEQNWRKLLPEEQTTLSNGRSFF